VVAAVVVVVLILAALVALRSQVPGDIVVTPTSQPSTTGTASSPTATASAAASTPAASQGPALVTTTPMGTLRGQIAWVTRAASLPTPATGRALTNYELWAVPLDGSAPRMAVRYQSSFVEQNMFDFRDTNILRRQFSPDGRRAVLSVSDGAQNQELRVINLETGAISIPFPGSHVDVDVAWSPDGSRLAFVRRVPVAGGVGSGAIWVANVDGSNARMLRSGGQASPPRLFGWLPDSQRLAFDPVNFEHAYIAVLDMSGTASPQGYEVNSVDPASWRTGSPALTVGINLSGNVGDHFQIVAADAPDQRSPRIVADVTTNPNDRTITGVRDPRWDPAGSQTLIYVEDGTQGSFVIADLSAGTTKRVSSRVGRADWLPSGDGIVTIEEHPSTAPRSVYVWEKDGRLRKSGLVIDANLTDYTLTDLAARTY